MQRSEGSSRLKQCLLLFLMQSVTQRLKKNTIMARFFLCLTFTQTELFVNVSWRVRSTLICFVFFANANCKTEKFLLLSVISVIKQEFRIQRIFHLSRARRQKTTNSHKQSQTPFEKRAMCGGRRKLRVFVSPASRSGDGIWNKVFIILGIPSCRLNYRR